MPLVVAAVFAIAALSTLLALPGGAGEQPSARTASTASLTLADRPVFDGSTRPGQARRIASGSPRSVRMPSP